MSRSPLESTGYLDCSRLTVQDSKHDGRLFSSGAGSLGPSISKPCHSLGRRVAYVDLAAHQKHHDTLGLGVEGRFCPLTWRALDEFRQAGACTSVSVTFTGTDAVVAVEKNADGTEASNGLERALGGMGSSLGEVAHSAGEPQPRGRGQGAGLIETWPGNRT